MNKTNKNALGFFVYTFMFAEFGLGGGSLLVYAIIYSFTKGENGTFYGSNDYLTKASGLSLGSVKNALSYLLKNGYIEKINYSGRRGYRAIDKERIERASASEEWVECASSNRKMQSDAASVDTVSSECVQENGEKGETLAFGLEKENLNIEELLANLRHRPKYKFYKVGRNELVSMTDEQYEKLLKLVDSEVLFAYLRRLELLIRDKGYRTFSPYKTIKKWIKEDTEV